MLGEYKINVIPGCTKLPQVLASGLDNVLNSLVGASYKPIAYLGSQLVHGTNHALLCEQTLITGKAPKAIVLVVINEKTDEEGKNNLSIVDITKVLDGSNTLGGINISINTKVPDDIMNLFNERFKGLLGATHKPFAVLATQVTNGTAYYLAVESSLITGPVGDVEVFAPSEIVSKIQIVKIFSKYPEIQFKTILAGNKDTDVKVDEDTVNPSSLAGKVFGYAFTWLTPKDSWC